MSERDPFARELAALVGEEPPAGHPTDSRLAAYADCQLEPEDADAVQRHLAVCRRCARIVAEATLFTQREPVPGEPDAAATAAAWAATRAQLVEQGVLPAAAPQTHQQGGHEANHETRHEAGHEASREDRSARPPSPAFRPRSPASRFGGLAGRGGLGRPAVAWALAAALALCVVGLGAWNVRLADRLAEPVANVPILDLSLTVTRSSGGAPVEVPADAARAVVLLLAPERLPAHPSYGAELVGPGGERLWRIEGLAPSEFDTFSIQVPSHRIPAGTSRLRLLGLGPEAGTEDGSGGELLEEHELRKAG